MNLSDEQNAFSLKILGVHEYRPEMMGKIQAMIGADPRVRLVDEEEPWLDVRVEASTQAGSWECEDNFLELHDIAFLTTWFRGLASGAQTDRAIAFEEPILAFEAVGTLAEGLRLRVILDGDCRPPWNQGVIGDEPDPSFEIEVSASMLRRAARDLEDQLRNLG